MFSLEDALLVLLVDSTTMEKDYKQDDYTDYIDQMNEYLEPSMPTVFDLTSETTTDNEQLPTAVQFLKKQVKDA